MASIASVSESKRENGRIYLSGYVTGVETGYNYCIVYSYNGGSMQNVGNVSRSYTYFCLASLPKGTLKKYYFSERGAWVPDHGDGTYKIICNMVGSNCEDIHVQESAKSFSVTTTTPTPDVPPDDDPYIPPQPPSCNEGETVCEYSAEYDRQMIKKCVNGKLVFDKWCGTSDTCNDGVCVPPKVCSEGDERNPQTCWDDSQIHTQVCRNNAWVASGETCPVEPQCAEGAIVCKYSEDYDRHMLMKCVNGKLVFDKWCGTSDTCNDGVCVPPQEPDTPPVVPPESLINCTTTPRLDNVRVNVGGATLVTNLPSGGTNNHIFPHGSYTISVEPPAGYRVVSMNPPEGRFQFSEDLTIAVVLEKGTPPVERPEYLTPAQADERVRSGLSCYIKCTLPLLDTIPGIRYVQGVWMLPFFAITSKP